MVKRLLHALSLIWKIPLLLSAFVWALPYWIITGEDAIERLINSIFGDV